MNLHSMLVFYQMKMLHLQFACLYYRMLVFRLNYQLALLDENLQHQESFTWMHPNPVIFETIIYQTTRPVLYTGPFPAFKPLSDPA